MSGGRVMSRSMHLLLSLSLPDVDTDRPDVSTFSTFPSFHDGLEL